MQKRCSWDQIFIWLTCKIGLALLCSAHWNHTLSCTPFCSQQGLQQTHLSRTTPFEWLYQSPFSFFFRLILSRIIQHILACLHTAHRKTGKVEKSLLPANSLLWAKYFENNNDLALCTSSISSSSSLGGDIRDCRPFELLVDKRSAKIPPCCFSQLVPGAISGFKMVSG